MQSCIVRTEPCSDQDEFLAVFSSSFCNLASNLLEIGNILSGRSYLPLISQLFHSMQLVTSIAALLLAGRHLEPFWGSKEFMKFIISVNLFTCASTFVLAVFLYFITRQGDYL